MIEYVDRKPKPKMVAPLELLGKFAKGNWVGMLAERYGMSETVVQSRLMDAASKLLKERKKRALEGT